MDKINQIKFKIGFWHPFGPHGCKPNGEIESRKEIIKRKNDEIRKNGWTLWSFQYRKDETMNQWIHQIKKNRVFVFCSNSKGTHNPIGNVSNAKQFRRGAFDKWINIPKMIKIPHPFGKKILACAFKVKAISNPKIIKIPERIKWFSVQDKKWREDNLPTRGEFLIKSGGKSKLRPIYVVLELSFPYVVVIKK